MAVSGHVRVDTREFSRTLKKYMSVSKRSLAEAINQKGFSVSINAVRFTRRADKKQIAHTLRQVANERGAPLAALIINNGAKKGSASKPWYYGADMAEAIKKLIEKRQRAVNFLRAGWLPAVTVFASAIGKTPTKNAVKFIQRYGIHGGATKARPGIKVFAELWNMAFNHKTGTENGMQFAEKGLAFAMAKEAASMKRHIEKELRKDADAIQRRLFG